MTLRELQLILLEMLKEFDKVCRENDITYYLIGGSALGAVRHEGFIPWDDDIDIGVPRKDYEKLCKIINNKLSSRLLFMSIENDADYHIPIGRLLLNDNNPKQSDHTICIDIFALDGAPKSQLQRKIQHYASLLYHISLLKKEPANRGDFIRKISKLFVAITPDFMFRFYAFISKKIVTYWDTETSQYWVNIFGAARYAKELMPKEYFGTPQLHQFETDEFYIIEQPDQYLTHIYGDYMKLPPEEKRKPAHAERDF